MDLLHKQILVLSNKIDALYQIVEQLNQKVSQALAEGRIKAAAGAANEQVVRGTVPARAPGVMPEHKDILVDDDYSHSRYLSGDRPLSAEVQIQRLTAQLTAAYNQIAALEEQLLSRHTH
ncbi:hypothetical protein BRW62_09470 [Parathermosynechococcus lividus PCC 6715]|uniref:Uncharacterized protein n=1 Tax=Parathermosynechococcus lividus PCC 6715 TaxID=1917166 RepID=A0A2D2Q349_PARLV|nr:hypothetical protein [Thermostichus lividus]ATS18933.1 hypothetical protein BRW62_09470 [Thermostichus lividus PCC 6715]